MKLFAVIVALGLSSLLRAAEWLPIERQVATAVESPKITVVHFWAPWCSNCKAELASHGWRDFLAANPNVNFIFITVWSDGKGDGRPMLEQYGVGRQPNFQLLLHPNTSRKAAQRMTTFMDLPVTWIPSTWVFREGTLRYALNYGELRFPILQQLIADSSDEWEH